MRTYQELLEKHSPEYIFSVIEQKSENDKESNLKFIQELDRETWSSLKTMISLGMDSWKTLSNKNKNIYIQPTEQEAEQTESLENQAQMALGEDYTQEQYQQWLNDRQHNDREDQLAYDERDIMEDDDE